jgi:hypothetical protein
MTRRKNSSILDIFAPLVEMPSQRLARGPVGTVIEQLEVTRVLSSSVTTKAALTTLWPAHAPIRSFCTTCHKPPSCSPCGAPNAGVKYRKSGGGWSLPVGQKTVRAEDTDMAAVELKSAARMRSPRSEQSIRAVDINRPRTPVLVQQLIDESSAVFSFRICPLVRPNQMRQRIIL